MTEIEFSDIVSFAANNRSNVVYPNSSSERAVVVLKNIFEQSSEKLKLFANKFESEICDSEVYIGALTNLIKKGVPVEILFFDTPVEDSKSLVAIRKLASEGSGQVDLRIITKEGKSAIGNINAGKDFYFAVADGSMYRFETDVTNHKAFFCFNDTARSTILTTLFDRAFATAKSCNKLAEA